MLKHLLDPRQLATATSTRRLLCRPSGVSFVSAGVATAGIPDPDISFAKLGPDPGMTTCPAGDVPLHQNLTVTAKRANTTLVEGIPYSSFFFTVTGDDCTFHRVDAETDINGEIRFEAHGDETISGTITIGVQIHTVALTDADDLECITFDTKRDDQVSPQDFTLFSVACGGADPLLDCNWDGNVALQDFTLFSTHYGH